MWKLDLTLILGYLHSVRILDQVEEFPSNATLSNSFFAILFKLSATCFGRTTIFRWKYLHRKFELNSRKLLKYSCVRRKPLNITWTLLFSCTYN
jgi:hypothetical protein